MLCTRCDDSDDSDIDFDDLPKVSDHYMKDYLLVCKNIGNYKDHDNDDSSVDRVDVPEWFNINHPGLPYGVSLEDCEAGLREFSYSDFVCIYCGTKGMHFVRTMGIEYVVFAYGETNLIFLLHPSLGEKKVIDFPEQYQKHISIDGCETCRQKEIVRCNILWGDVNKCSCSDTGLDHDECYGTIAKHHMHKIRTTFPSGSTCSCCYILETVRCEQRNAFRCTCSDDVYKHPNCKGYLCNQWCKSCEFVEKKYSSIYGKKFSSKSLFHYECHAHKLSDLHLMTLMDEDVSSEYSIFCEKLEARKHEIDIENCYFKTDVSSMCGFCDACYEAEQLSDYMHSLNDTDDE